MRRTRHFTYNFYTDIDFYEHHFGPDTSLLSLEPLLQDKSTWTSSKLKPADGLQVVCSQPKQGSEPSLDYSELSGNGNFLIMIAMMTNDLSIFRHLINLFGLLSPTRITHISSLDPSKSRFPSGLTHSQVSQSSSSMIF
jgi:hypothetical protein